MDAVSDTASDIDSDIDSFTFGPGPHRFRDPLRIRSRPERVDRLVPNFRPDPSLVEHFERSHFRGDPAADALVDWMHRVGVRDGRRVVELAIEHGLAAVQDPPDVVRAFFEEVEVVPAWLDRKALARACALCRRVALGHDYVLFSISLLAGYVSAGVTKTLAATGELETMAGRRLAETSQFIQALYESGTIPRESEGWKSVIRVRLMHAFVRRKLLASGWETSRWGVPINQADMAGTVLSFSITYLLGLRMLGFVVSRRDREALVHLWRYVGRLLGVSDSLLPATEREGLRLLWLVAATQDGPDEDGRMLARALLDVPSTYRSAGVVGDMLGRFDARFCAGFTRAFVGDEAADQLGLPDTAWKYAFVGFAAINVSGEVARLCASGRGEVRARLGRMLNELRRSSMAGGARATFAPRTGAPGV